jgi:HEAT repeat protein
VEAAIKALRDPNEPAAKKAVDYLVSHPAQAISPLREMLRGGGSAAPVGPPVARFVALSPATRRALTALARTREETAITFLIDLMKNNFYAKEGDGSRVRYGLGTNNGCIPMPYLFGGAVAEALGETGDRRVVPALQEAVRQGDYEVSAKARAALAKLGVFVLER